MEKNGDPLKMGLGDVCGDGFSGFMRGVNYVLIQDLHILVYYQPRPTLSECRNCRLITVVFYVCVKIKT